VPAPLPPSAREQQREPTSVTFWMSRRDRARLLDALGALHTDRTRALLSLLQPASRKSRRR
jgi:hypothetical protein